MFLIVAISVKRSCAAFAPLILLARFAKCCSSSQHTVLPSRMKTDLLSIIPVLLALFACAVLAGAQSTPQPASGTGLEGSISVSPIQGGPTRQGVPDSKPLPKTAFTVKQGDRTVASFETDEQGRFRVSLPPGHYTIAKKDWQGGLGSFVPFEVDVTQGQMKSVQWTCDTGIR